MKINVLAYLEETVRKMPDKIALKDQEKTLSFSELLVGAKRIGSGLISEDKNQPILVISDRTIGPILGFMGVLYSGNCYVPLDNTLPVERMKTMIRSLDAKAILMAQKYEKILDGIEDLPEIYYIENLLQGSIDEEKLDQVRKMAIDVDPAYIIYTSGSTGLPKGIAVSHKNVIDLAEWIVETFEFSDQDVIGNQTPFYFDASVKDIFIMLKTGASLCVIPRTFFMFPVKLIDYLNQEKVTSILWATSAMNLMMKSKVFKVKKPAYLSKVFFAGETMYGKVLNYWKSYIKEAMFVNLYGPTEATVDATYYVVNREFEDDESVPIGKACRNMDVFLLNGKNEKIVDDSLGEICIRGTGLAYGYYNDPEKTDQVFIQNPISKFYYDRIYCTGDIGKYNDYGEIVFVSRKDNQIKHMGYRIELGDVEVALNSLQEVDAGVCFYNQRKSKIVLAYVGQIEEKEIVKELMKILPKYMLPNDLVRMEEFPYNKNDKIDRNKIAESYYNE